MDVTGVYKYVDVRWTSWKVIFLKVFAKEKWAPLLSDEQRSEIYLKPKLSLVLDNVFYGHWADFWSLSFLETHEEERKSTQAEGNSCLRQLLVEYLPHWKISPCPLASVTILVFQLLCVFVTMALTETPHFPYIAEKSFAFTYTLPSVWREGSLQ